MSQILAPFQLLELNVISAQDLAPVTRNMRTYAVAWVHPDRKLSTRVDTQGHTNPTWNDKFVFRVDEEFLYADTSAIMIEIYALHWFKDVHVGTVRVLVGNLIPPPARPFHNNRAPLGMRFVALQVRRASGRPQGILNIGVAVLDSSMRSMPLYTLNSSAVGYRHLMGETDAHDSHNHLSPHKTGAAVATANAAAMKPELRRTKSDSSSMVVSEALMARRAVANKGKSNSVISGAGSSLASSSNSKSKKKKKGKRRSRANSTVASEVSDFSDVKEKERSGKSSSLLSGSLPWKLKKNKGTDASNYTQSASDAVMEAPPPFYDTSVNNYIEDFHSTHINKHSEAVEVGYNDNADAASSVNTISAEGLNSEITNNELHGNGDVPESRPSQTPKFQASPAMQYHDSPGDRFRNSPASHFIKSPVAAVAAAAVSQSTNSPKPQFANSPKPHFANSPKPHFANSPKPQFANSPKPQFANSPKPQFAVSQMPKFVNSPAAPYNSSPGPTKFRNSPAVSKFNPAVGFGGSNRATPMHQFGRLNGATPAFEYTTPRRSNLGHMGIPPVLTESELGPSASEVAAVIARKPPPADDGEKSTVGGWSMDESVEGLQSKLERWRTELPPVVDRGELSSFPTSSTKTTSRHTRRHTDGGASASAKSNPPNNGLFSCFSNICGVECSIVCGGDSKGKKNNSSNRRRTPSADDASFL